MEKNPRILFFALFFVAGIVATYLLIYQQKKDDLDHYMSVLGDRLVAMVPDGEGQEKLAGIYQDFFQRVKDREVAPNKVEQVAAVILNASNSGKTLSTEEAEQMFEMAIHLPNVDSLGVLAVLPPPSLDEWRKMGNRIKLAVDFDEKMRHGDHSLSLKVPENPPRLRYRVMDSLQIVVDSELRETFNGTEFNEIKKNIVQLESRKLLHWENLEHTIAIEMERVEKELERIADGEGRIHAVDGLRIGIQSLRSLRVLDSLNVMVPVNIDSILQEVEKELDTVKPPTRKK